MYSVYAIKHGHMWNIEFYQHSNGRIPFREFIDNLNEVSELPNVRNALDQLAEHGHNLRRPQVEYLQDNIYELRVKTIHGQIRCLYFFYDRTTIIVTHGFHKKSSSVPKTEKQRAMEYRSNYLSQQGNKNEPK